jgi:hypothetical protein
LIAVAFKCDYQSFAASADRDRTGHGVMTVLLGLVVVIVGVGVLYFGLCYYVVTHSID